MSNDKVAATYHPEPTTKYVPPRKKRRWVWPTVAVLALLAGVGIGTSSQPEPATVTKVIAGPTTTQRIPGPTVTVTKEKKVQVLQTPDVCVKALDAGDKVINIAAQGFTIVSKILNAASNLDVDGMTAGNKELSDLQPSLVSARSEYDSLSNSCKAAQ